MDTFDYGAGGKAAYVASRKNTKTTTKKGWVVAYAFGFLKLITTDGKAERLVHVVKKEEATLFSTQSALLVALQRWAFLSGPSVVGREIQSMLLQEVTITTTETQYKRVDFKWFGVDSSLADHVGYSREKRALAIEMVNGETYVYENVNESLAANLLFADSLGAYFNTYIKGQYPSVKL